ncbi:NIPSNAP family containing protein [Spirosoma taeanense]|uniref:NIPSNAP family containing protein n=1 Tax=Spirosoma taeanense TaxID=2735870 RepID=A0A6M5YD07_9BACT|nr:NIPSNAP family protein [Spirosoma taeanense]QJW90842.1 NIPSNAP family containing protein [Spirosoma taeanense]
MLSTRKTGHSIAFWLIAAFLITAVQAFSFAPKREFYQLKIYHLKDNNQKDRLETYLQQAYLPALHRAGIGKVGVFKPATNADSLVYVLIPFRSVDQFMSLSETLAKDKQYVAAGQDYINAEYNNPVFSNIESVLMEAFAGMPTLIVPKLQAQPSERIYELRRYEAATEKLHENKISQFNNGELDIFKRLGFNTVFCGQVKAGSKLPSLMYMTSFENKASRDEHWKSFSADPGWKQLNSKPEYAHNFLRADIYLLHPTTYSEI